MVFLKFYFGMIFEGLIGILLDDDLVIGFGRDGFNGIYVIKFLVNFIIICSNGFIKDVGKFKIEFIGFFLREKLLVRVFCMFFIIDL